MGVKLIKPRVSGGAAPIKRLAVERLRGSGWMRIRDRVMRRDCGLCQACRRSGALTLATQVDHITALRDGGSNDDRNLQALCDACHKAKTAAEGARHA